MKEETLTLQRLSRDMGYSAYHATRKFREIAGMPLRDYLRRHPNAAVVNLGCGLDDTGRSCDNGTCKIYNLDFSGVIAVRDALLPAGDQEENIACDLNDTSWFRRIDASGGAVFFAAGVFYYFLTEQVRALVQAMTKAFPGSRLVFDAANQKAVRLMLKT